MTMQTSVSLFHSTLPDLLEHGYALSGGDGHAHHGVFEASFFPRRGRGKPSHSHDLDEPDGWYLPQWGHSDVRARLFDPSRWILAPHSLVTGPRCRDLTWFVRGLDALNALDPAFCQRAWTFRDELEALARAKLAHSSPAARMILNGVTPINVREEGFAALYVAVLKIARVTYAFFRAAGYRHARGVQEVVRRLQSAQPNGVGANGHGVWLTSLVDKYTANHRAFYFDRGRRLVAATEELVARAVTTTQWPWVYQGVRFGRRPDFVAPVLGHLLLRLHRRELPYEAHLGSRRAFKRQELARAAALVWRYRPDGAFDPERFEAVMPQAALLVRSTFARRIGQKRASTLASVLAEAGGIESAWVDVHLDKILEEARERSGAFLGWLDDGLSRLQASSSA